jgi:hypothetical protein
MLRISPIVCAALFASSVLASSSARADVPPAAAPLADARVDEVLLTDGGRVRGTIMVEDARSGVSIRLPDGTTAFVPAARIVAVHYAYAPSTYPGMMPPYTLPPPPPLQRRHRRPGLIAGGGVLMGLGLVHAMMGGYFIAFSQAQYSSTCITDEYSNGEYWSSGCDHRDDTLQSLGIGMLVGGGLALAAGIPMLVIGLKKVPDTSSAASAPLSIGVRPMVGGVGFGLSGVL